MTLNDRERRKGRYFTEFGRFGANYVTVIDDAVHTVCDKNVGKIIQFSAIYYNSQRSPREMRYRQVHQLDSKNSTYAGLRGHVSNS